MMKKGAKVWSFIAILTVVGLMFSGLIDTTSATSEKTTEKTTINVLDSPPWFTKECYSKEKLWWWLHQYEETHDYYISTYVGGMSRLGGSASKPNCWAKFKPYLSQSGKYEVYAYFYAWKYTSTKVPFTVKYDGGSTTIKVDQSSSIPTWKEESLGTWYFEAGQDTYVKVTDATGERYNETKGLTIGAIKFVKKETVPTPVVTGIDPSRPTASPAKQWITIIGTGFVSDSIVTLRIGSSKYSIPAGRTEFKSSTQIRVRAGLTPGTWSAQVTNPGNRISNLFSFMVKQDIPSPVHDMAVTTVYTTPSSPNVGQSTTIHVTVKNEGSQQENYVPVKAYVDGSQVGSAQFVTLTDGKSTTKSFTWTPSTAKTYSVKGEVGVVSGETETSDNTKTISVSVSPAPSSMPTTTASPQTGSIIVTAILDQATFTITGPKTYHGSGKSWSEPNAPVGTYRIIYEAVVKKENGKAVGYDVLKKSEEKALIAGGSVRFDVEYIKNTPPTRGKISYFCPSCWPTSAWEEPLGESCGKDDAAKYWFVAMRWPYAKWDYNIEDTVSTGLSKGSDWKNKKILVTNPKNGRQVVLEAKDWGPAPWTGRVIDVSPTALGALDAETDEEVNIEFADKNAELGPPPSTKFKTGDLIVTKKKWNLRSDRKIAEEYKKTTLDKGSDGKVLENNDNGKFVPDNKYYWWYVKFGDYEGWCAEEGLEKSETAPKVAKPVLTYPLKITPEKDKYYVGDTLSAQFNITNKGTKPITFDKLTVGGRLNGECPDNKCPDFTFRSTTLQPNVPYQYTGTFRLTQPGNYLFFVAYYIENPTPEEKKLLDENNWNTSVDLGEGLTDEDRIEDIEVLSLPEGPFPSPPTPLTKTVKAVHEAIFEPATAEMTISYNWFGQDENGEDVYVISEIDCQSLWFVGYYEVSIESPSGTIWNHKTVTIPPPFNPHGSPLDFGTLYLPSRETSEGIKVHACEWISVKAYGVTEVEMLSIISIVGGIVVRLPPMPASPLFFSESAAMYIAPDYIDTSDFPPIVIEEIEILPATLGHLCSPGELRIYDSQGRVTGLLNGEIKQEIPDSAYFNGSFVILSSSDSYRYEVVGTETGTYDLGVISIGIEKVNAFGATDIPTSTNAIHQYTIDWAALSQGEKGVTVKIDSDGNDVVEHTVITNNSFHPLIAEFTFSPENPIIGEKVTLDASTSFDLGGGVIKKYRWEFYNAANQDPFYVIEGHDKEIISYSFNSEGIYLVRLTVTDDEGEYSYTESSITIKESIKEPVFYVPDDYPSIQAAVDAANAGDTIIVRDGTYTENVTVNKRLTIQSENGYKNW